MARSLPLCWRCLHGVTLSHATLFILASSLASCSMAAEYSVCLACWPTAPPLRPLLLVAACCDDAGCWLLLAMSAVSRRRSYTRPPPPTLLMLPTPLAPPLLLVESYTAPTLDLLRHSITTPSNGGCSRCRGRGRETKERASRSQTQQLIEQTNSCFMDACCWSLRRKKEARKETALLFFSLPSASMSSDLHHGLTNRYKSAASKPARTHRRRSARSMRSHSGRAHSGVDGGRKQPAVVEIRPRSGCPSCCCGLECPKCPRW